MSAKVVFLILKATVNADRHHSQNVALPCIFIQREGLPELNFLVSPLEGGRRH